MKTIHFQVSLLLTVAVACADRNKPSTSTMVPPPKRVHFIAESDMLTAAELERLEVAARNGDDDAAIKLANNRFIIGQDEKGARRWLRLAASRGAVRAQAILDSLNSLDQTAGQSGTVTGSVQGLSP